MTIKNIELFIKEFLLNIFLKFRSSKKNHVKIDLDQNSNILVIRLNRISDALVTTPLLKLLKKKTNCNITVLASDKNHFIFENNPNVNNTIVFNENNRSIFNNIQSINKKKYDVIIDAHSSASTTVSLIVGLLKSDNKISLKKNNQQLYSQIIDRANDIHIIDEILLLANAFSFDYSKINIDVEFNPTLEARQSIIDFIIKKKLDRTKPLIGINISAGSNSKYWGTDRFNRLVKYLENYDIEVIILHSDNDSERATRISQKNSIIFKNNSFDKFTAMIYELDFLFTPDTYAVHLAASKKTQMFILYQKKEIAKKWCPYNSSYDCVITEDNNFAKLSYGKTLNSFIPFFDNFYKQYLGNEIEDIKRGT